MEKATYTVGDKVEVTIHGKTWESTVEAVALQGSYEPVWMYKVGDGFFYKDFNLKPVERKPRFKFKVGDKVNHKANKHIAYTVSECVVKNDGPWYNFVGFEDVGPFREDDFNPVLELPKPKFKVGDVVMAKSRPNGMPREIELVTVTSKGVSYYLKGRTWAHREDDLVLYESVNRPAYQVMNRDKVFRKGQVRKIASRETIFAVVVKYEDGSSEMVTEDEVFEVISGD